MTPTEAIEHFKISIRSEFVPFSHSRYRAEKSPSLNWRVTLMHDGRHILTTDYSAGCAHAPSYKPHFGKRTVERENAVKAECETGFAHKQMRESTPFYPTRKAIEPKAENVVHSLIMDSDVLDAGGFESWARDLGYDADSRKAEAIYNTCVEIALKMRATFGDSDLAQLREAFQNY